MSSEKNNSLTDKGGVAEEALRSYFLELGMYVTRGLKFIYQSNEVTDVDLFLITKPSAVSRHKTVVDIRNKKQPEALSRILWTKGLKEALRADSATVATSDKNESIRAFAESNGIALIDGLFIQNLIAHYKTNMNRISEEHLFSELRKEKDPIRRSWLDRFESAKNRLLLGMNFDGCNAWLEDSRFYLEESIAKPKDLELSLRLFYLCISYFFIGFDYRAHKLSFLSAQEKSEIISNGFKFGETGIDGIEKLIDKSLRVIRVSKVSGIPHAAQIKEALLAELSKMPLDILSQHFSKLDVQKDLFQVAVDLELAAFKRHLPNPEELSVSVRSNLGALLDFWKIDRKKFFELRLHKNEQQQLTLDENKSAN